MKSSLLILTLLLQSLVQAQIKENVYSLRSETENISREVKAIVSENIEDKQFVFLGEAFHKSGADLKMKTEFVKYLVEEKGFQDIIFESDFYALFKEHSRTNVYGIWTQAEQCQELFKIIEDHRVIMWGMDNKFHTPYSKDNFSQQLSLFLQEEGIFASDRYISVVDQILKAEFALRDNVNDQDLEYFDVATSEIMRNEKLQTNLFWHQALQNLRSSSLIYRYEDIESSMAERDRQMAANLDYFSKEFPDKKFIVWAANAHISRTDSDYMGEATMGREFLKANPDNSYHIAFGSMKMPYRKIRRTERRRKSEKNLLHYLPDINSDYFIDAKTIRNKNPEIANSPFYAILWSAEKRHLETTWLEHFDAIVFIEKGELVDYIE